MSIELPARNRVLLVLPLTLVAASSFYGVIWWGYRWLASTSTVKGALLELAMGVLIAVEAAAVRTLLRELATTRLGFERTTIEVSRSVLGLGIGRQWYSCYRVAQFVVTHDAKHPEVVRIDIWLANGKKVLLAASLPTDVFTLLTHALRRKDFAYLKPDSD